MAPLRVDSPDVPSGLDRAASDQSPRRSLTALFRSGGTAANYVGCIRWAGEVLSLDHGWDTPAVRRTLQGLRAKETSAARKSLSLMLLLTTGLVRRLGLLCGHCLARYLVFYVPPRGLDVPYQGAV